VGPTQDAPVERDTFLELLRNVSVLRVVFLHLVLRPPLIYLPWIQWIYPGMPEIFFVSGVLMAGSLARRPTTAVVRDRARRVVVPFAAYVPFALGAMYVTDSRSSDPKASMVMRDVIGYLVPLVEPGGSQSRQILWSHLWFVTAFLWAILLAPLLVRLIDRIGAFVLGLPLGVFAAAIFVRKYLERPVPEEFVNISQFGTFFVLGLLAGRKRLGVSRSATRDPPSCIPVAPHTCLSEQHGWPLPLRSTNSWPSGRHVIATDSSPRAPIVRSHCICGDFLRTRLEHRWPSACFPIGGWRFRPISASHLVCCLWRCWRSAG
jgi:peptidoglycan/LPS O-acetylase OafA/YrhL